MGLFSNQFANVVEWEEYRDDVIFWKWTNREIKKDSKLIIKPGQDAIFLYNGAVALYVYVCHADRCGDQQIHG